MHQRPSHVVVRRSVPAHVTPTEEYRTLIDALSAAPERMARLTELSLYDPEQVFYIDGLGTDGQGRTSLMLRRPEGDAFAIEYAPAEFPKCVRWILNGPDQAVAAFALPSMCHLEGYGAERKKGNVRVLPPHGRAQFGVTLGYLNVQEAAEASVVIAGL